MKRLSSTEIAIVRPLPRHPAMWGNTTSGGLKLLRVRVGIPHKDPEFQGIAWQANTFLCVTPWDKYLLDNLTRNDFLSNAVLQF